MQSSSQMSTIGTTIFTGISKTLAKRMEHKNRVVAVQEENSSQNLKSFLILIPFQEVVSEEIVEGDQASCQYNINSEDDGRVLSVYSEIGVEDQKQEFEYYDDPKQNEPPFPDF